MPISKDDFVVIGRDGIIATDFDKITGVISMYGGPLEQQMNDSSALVPGVGKLYTVALWIFCSPWAPFGGCAVAVGGCGQCENDEAIDRVNNLQTNVAGGSIGASTNPELFLEIDEMV